MIEYAVPKRTTAVRAANAICLGSGIGDQGDVLALSIRVHVRSEVRRH